MTDLNGWTMSLHATRRAHELGYPLDDIASACLRPEIVYPGDARQGPNRAVYQRGNLALVTNPTQKRVITVLLRSIAPWEHGLHTRVTPPCRAL